MELTKEQTIKTMECCRDGDCDKCKLYDFRDCMEIVREFALHYLKENEPAPAGTDTSSKTNILHLDDSTSKQICQVFEHIKSACCSLLGAYDNMTVPEQRAFKLGKSYGDIYSANCELEKMLGGDSNAT